MYGSLKSAMKQATLYLIFICVKKITVYSPTPPPFQTEPSGKACRLGECQFFCQIRQMQV